MLQKQLQEYTLQKTNKQTQKRFPQIEHVDQYDRTANQSIKQHLL